MIFICKMSKKMLIEYRESIHTECRVPNPTLKIEAIKLDANINSLKKKVGCARLKSCDYLKKKKNKLYFIEISDFNAQFQDLSSSFTSDEAKNIIRNEIRLKLSESLLIFNTICAVFTIHREKITQNKALLALCKEKKSDIIAMAFIARAMEKHYCPTHFASIQIIPYTEINNIFQRR